MPYAKEIENRIFADHMTEPVKAAIYARVSTQNEGQQESCANQVEMAESFIAEHPNIQIVDRYVDDGISGTHDFNRPEYNRLLRDVEDGRVELIVVKDFSRLNRDEYNAMGLRNFLFQYDATVLTLLGRPEVHDLEDDRAEFQRKFDDMKNASYSKELSEKEREFQTRRCKNGWLYPKDIVFGYKWVNRIKPDKKERGPSGEIQIDQAEADVVEWVFEAYVYNNVIPSEIQRQLKSKGITICLATLNRMLQDTRYIGEFPINQRTTKRGRGSYDNKRVKKPKEEWVIVSRPDLAIVDKDLFDLAQRLRTSRQTTYTKGNFPKHRTQAYNEGTHLFANKIVCAECGKNFQYGHSDRKETIPLYRIHSHGECISDVSRVYEEDVIEIVQKALRSTIENQDGICTELESVLLKALRLSRAKGDTEIIKSLKQKRANKEKSFDSLMRDIEEGNYEGPARERIRKRMNDIANEIDSIDTEIRSRVANQIDESYITAKMAEIRKAIQSLKKFESLERSQVLRYIDRILVRADNNIDIILQSGPSSGSAKKFLGATFQYSIPQRGRRQALEITVRAYLKA